MAKRNNLVTIKIHKNFFDNIFEPERRKLGKRFNTEFTQSKFTEYLSKSGAKLWYPKRNIKKIKDQWRFNLTL